LLRKLADRCGLTAALEAALTQRGMFPQFSRGVVLVSTAIAIALGATAMADIAVLGQLAPVLGPATSASTVRRTLNLASDRVLVRIAQARARIRAHVWQQTQDAGGFPWLEIAGNCSSTWAAPLVTAHSGK
jgi:ABC-type transport system involved in cytochrome bd biosynthesis fused ATPase/permease subunit